MTPGSIIPAAARLLYTIAVASFGFPICGAVAQQYSDGPQAGSIDIGFWSRILRTEFPDNQYFLNELAISGEQRDELTKSFAKLKREIERAQIEAYVVIPERIRTTENVAERNELQNRQQELENKSGEQLPRQFLERIDEILLPHQQKRFKQVMLQRMFQLYGDENFQLISLCLRICKFELSSQEKKRFELATYEALKKYQVERQKLKSEAWEKLNQKLPSELLAGMKEILGDRMDVDQMYLETELFELNETLNESAEESAAETDGDRLKGKR